jgi:hypothetical protein
MKAYKIPSEINIDEFIKTVDEITIDFYINPVQDINDNWFISEEEWNCDKWKVAYPEDIINQFEYLDYIPNPKYIIDLP